MKKRLFQALRHLTPVRLSLTAIITFPLEQHTYNHYNQLQTIMIITIMSLFSIIPFWFTAVLLYLASPKQRFLASSIHKPTAYSMALVLVLSGVIILTLQYPIISAMLASLVLIMFSLVSVTLISGYSVKRLYLCSTLVFLLSLFFGGISYVA